MDNKLIGIKISKYMQKNDISLEKLASILNITPKTLKNKLQGEGKFYVTEIIKMKEVFGLELEEFEELFFSFK